MSESTSGVTRVSPPEVEFTDTQSGALLPKSPTMLKDISVDPDEDQDKFRVC